MVSSALDHNKPRVLVSGLSNGLGGTEIVVGRYIKALSSYATFEFLATSDLSDVAFVHEMNSEIHICPDIDRPIKRFEYLDHLFQDEPNRYQAVWCNFNHLLYADVLRAAQRANVSVRIAHSHNSRFLGGLPTQVISRFNRRAALRNSNVRLACSKEAGSFFWGDNFQVLPNALNFNDMEYDPVSRVVIREEFGLSSKDFLIGTVGRLTSQKNHIFLLKIMKELLTVKSNCKLMIVGDGPLHKSLQESAAKLGISSSVLFAGERKDIKDILSSFDCFVFPSTFEGLGVAAIEAQLNGLPCVCSFGVPDAADISDKFLKCSFNVAEWIDAIISMGRPNKLAGGGLFMTSTSKQVNCCQSSLVDNPLVSVIVPMYNAEKTIQKTLNSLQRQSVSNIEIIIVDDGSTDRGAELVMAIAEGDNRIKLISQNNSGVCVARNRGIDEASGDWVAFVDADDMLPINAVRLLLESSDGCSLVIGALLNEHGDYSGKAISIDWKTACSLSLAFWDNVNKVPFSSFTKGVVFRSVCGKIFKKSLFRNGFLKFEDGIRFGEDALFMVDAYRLAESVKVVDSAVYCYVNNSDSVTRNTDISAIESVDNLLVKLYELCHVNPDLSELYKQSAVREVLSLIRNCARLESNQLFKPVSNMVCQSYFSYLMEGFASHRYSRRFISEVKNRITIRLLLARRVMAAIGFTKFVYGVR